MSRFPDSLRAGEVEGEVAQRSDPVLKRSEVIQTTRSRRFSSAAVAKTLRDRLLGGPRP